MCLCTCVCILHQDPQCIRVYSFHLHLFLLGLPHITGEHGREVVWHGREDQSVRGESVRHQSERMDDCDGGTEYFDLADRTGFNLKGKEGTEGNSSLEMLTQRDNTHHDHNVNKYKSRHTYKALWRYRVLHMKRLSDDKTVTEIPLWHF